MLRLGLKNRVKSSIKHWRYQSSANNSAVVSWYYKQIYKPKPNTLSEFYHYLSKAKPALTVIQVGANDGITHDPIHKFVKRDGWHGVLIEPQTLVFEQALKKVYQNTQHIFLENVAIAEQEGFADLYHLSFCYDRWATGLSTFHLPTLQQKVDNGEIERLANKNGVKLPDNKSEYIAHSRVETKTFASIREKYNLTSIDVLQIDTEGFDLEIIRLFEPDIHPVGVIVFESQHFDAEEYQQMLNWLRSLGFILKKIKGDTVAVHQSFAQGVQTFKQMTYFEGDSIV